MLIPWLRIRAPPPACGTVLVSDVVFPECHVDDVIGGVVVLEHEEVQDVAAEGLGGPVHGVTVVNHVAVDGNGPPNLVQLQSRLSV